MDLPPSDQPPLHAAAAEAYLAAIPTAPAPPTANAIPDLGPIPYHPPYNEMITQAITALKERDGSSKQAISKFIEASYPNLPAAHPALLTHHLKRLKTSGQLVMVKKSYMLPPPPGPGSDPVPPPPPTMAASPAELAGSPALKRRGRPAKPKAAAAEPQPAADGIGDPSSGLGNGGVVRAKKRGRPSKPKPAPAAVDHQDLHQQPPVYAAEPINTAVVGSGLVNGSAALPKRRGRPPKDKAAPSGERVPAAWTEVGGGVPAPAKRRPVRPPKGNRPRGRPRKNGGLVAPVSQAPTGGARGQWKRAALAADGGSVPAVGMKRQGRPPKSAAGPAKLRIGRTGRPVGRPRKNSLNASAQAYGQSEGTATEELTRKLEYMQLKVKNAVGLLKPHLINANIIDILTAIQDLEELAAMDITVPPMTEIPTAPVAEPSAPTTADVAAPPVDRPAPVFDLTTPAYAADTGVAGQLPPVTFF